jgi:hypothetical protein
MKLLALSELRPGMVVRADWSELDEGFEDMTVIANDPENRMVTFARPYLYATSVETCCPNYLVGVEKFQAFYRDDVKYIVKSEGYVT